MYQLLFTTPAKKDLKKIDKAHLTLIKNSLVGFFQNFNDTYEQRLVQKGKIKKLQEKKSMP